MVKTQCCNYDHHEDCRYPVFWNEGNGVVQCHACGETYLPAEMVEISPDGSVVAHDSKLKEITALREALRECVEVLKGLLPEHDSPKDFTLEATAPPEYVEMRLEIQSSEKHEKIKAALTHANKVLGESHEPTR